jgi:hypothetical protein
MAAAIIAATALIAHAATARGGSRGCWTHKPQGPRQCWCRAVSGLRRLLDKRCRVAAAGACTLLLLLLLLLLRGAAAAVGMAAPRRAAKVVHEAAVAGVRGACRCGSRLLPRGCRRGRPLGPKIWPLGAGLARRLRLCLLKTAGCLCPVVSVCRLLPEGVA